MSGIYLSALLRLDGMPPETSEVSVPAFANSTTIVIAVPVTDAILEEYAEEAAEIAAQHASLQARDAVARIAEMAR